MRINRLIALSLSLVAIAAAWAQNSTLTPYSKYGYGVLNDNATSAQRAMGGVGYAMNSGRQVNVMNPASYAAIDSLTFLFDMGVDFKCLWSQENGVSESNFTGGLDYITMAFPVAKRVGASIGMLPFSSTGYQFGDTILNGATTRSGNGDINEIYLGVGVNPFRNAYVGANVYYVFGTIVNDTYAYTSSGSTSLFERYMKVKDWRLDIGVQYDIPVNYDSKVTLGLTFSPGKSLHGETYGVSYDTSASSTVEVDTTGYTKLGGKYSMPATWGGGVSYNWRNRLVAELDFTYQPWKDVKYAKLENFETSEFANRYKIAGGLQYSPNPRGGYWQRTQYRLGAYYNHDYIMVRGNNVREYGVTAGFGFPVPQFKTYVNLGFAYKHRQAHPNPLVKEDYFTITLGINFNEMWFRQSKLH